MREIKINPSMEIHYTTVREDYSYTDGLGLVRRFQEEVKDVFLVVKTQKGDWVNITHALPDDMKIWCENECEADLKRNREVA